MAGEATEGIYGHVYAAPKDRQVALHLSRHMATAAPRLAEELGVPVGPVIHVYLVPDADVTPDTAVADSMFVDLGRLSE